MKAELNTIEKDYRMLCDEIGERHLGSAGEKQAADYLEQRFSSLGYEATAETFEAPGWRYESHKFSISGFSDSIESYPCFYSNSCRITDKPLIIDNSNSERLDDLDLRGRLCFITLSTDSGPNIGSRNEFAEKLDRLGAAAAIFISCYSDTYNTKIVRTPHLKQLAVLCVSGNIAIDLARQVDRKWQLEITAETSIGPSWNIVARPIGHSTSTSRKILITSHYDTPPDCPGAGDNASGTVAILELARLLRDQVENYTLEFIAFSGEEYGGMMEEDGTKGYAIGSYMYTKQHKSELADIAYMFSIDDVGIVLGDTGVFTNDDDFRALLKSELAEKSMTIEDHYYQIGDDFIFSEHGIPTALLIANSRQYLQIHSPKDTIERISFSKTAQIINTVAELILTLDRRKK